MKFNVRILEVLESWPLQLFVQFNSGARRHIDLLEDTRVYLKSREVDVSCLKPNLMIEISTIESEESAQFSARSICIL